MVNYRTVQMSSDRAVSDLRRVISGGQTGVDRGALDAAIFLQLPHGGKCPSGRLAEDGCIPATYQLQETASRRYSIRTEQNVIDADGTLIIFYRHLNGGTAFTLRMTEKHQKPCFLFDCTDPPAIADVTDWLNREGIETLNCAGPRESSCPGIGSIARQLCVEIFTEATAERPVVDP